MHAAVLSCEQLLCTSETTSSECIHQLLENIPQDRHNPGCKKDVHLQKQDIVVKRRAGKMSEAWKA